jgi:putative intracellular protease/amidase
LPIKTIGDDDFPIGPAPPILPASHATKEVVMAKILIVLTSHGDMGTTGRATGFYFEELAVPYWAFTDAGHEVHIASIAGGKAVHDPGSLKADVAARPASVQRFVADGSAMAKLEPTLAVAEVNPQDYAGIFLPGGHGTMWDFADNPALSRAVSGVYANAGLVGAVCHGPAGLVGAIKPDGTPLVASLRVNSFTDAEEEALGLTGVVPFALESRLRELGAKFEGAPNFTAKAVQDGRLITGQNPMSSAAVAALFVEGLAAEAVAA